MKRTVLILRDTPASTTISVADARGSDLVGRTEGFLSVHTYAYMCVYTSFSFTRAQFLARSLTFALSPALAFVEARTERGISRAISAVDEPMSGLVGCCVWPGSRLLSLPKVLRGR